MTDSELRSRFESLSLPPGEFSHREHVRVAWIYLRELPLLEALRVFPENLRRFAVAAGVPGLYHETITWAFLIVINERIARSGAEDFDGFAAANGDLFERGFLQRWYEPETLESALARETFLFPDRVIVEAMAR